MPNSYDNHEPKCKRSKLIKDLYKNVRKEFARLRGEKFVTHKVVLVKEKTTVPYYISRKKNVWVVLVLKNNVVSLILYTTDAQKM